MDQKPVYFDGSVQMDIQNNKEISQEPFIITDEMRISIGRNPYSIETN